MVKNPVMFVVEVGAVLTTIPNWLERFTPCRTVWIWTPDHALAMVHGSVANFAEAMAEGRGKAQADTLRKSRAETEAHRLRSDGSIETVASSKLRSGDIVVVTAGDFIPGDGEVIEGVASVDESAITGESAPVIRESGGDRSAVTGGTRVLSDEIKVRITSNPARPFSTDDQAGRGSITPENSNEIALNILLAGLTIIFLPGRRHASAVRDLFRRSTEHLRVGLASCMPDTDDHWRIALGDRHRRDGPHDSAQRDRDVRACRRSLRD